MTVDATLVFEACQLDIGTNLNRLRRETPLDVLQQFRTNFIRHLKAFEHLVGIGHGQLEGGISVSKTLV